tara:strand:- start:13225 stop:14367 length:1143 start_codon:yes stop_codon:yes gene_type:complete
MSSLSEKEIKQLNSITPIYSNQKDNSSIATDISPPPAIDTKTDLTNNISYDITSLLNKESGIDNKMKNLPFLLVSYHIQKDSYKPFLLFHIEETKGKYGFPEMDVNKEEIFDNNYISNPENEKTFIEQILEQFLGVANKNEKDTESDTESDNDDSSKSDSDNNTEVSEDGITLTSEIQKSYSSITGLPEEPSENNYKGFIKTTNVVYFFFEHYELYENNNHWATIDELSNQKNVYNGTVKDFTTDLFTQIPESTKLLSNNKLIEVPKVCYLANYTEDSYSTQYFEENTKPFSVDSFVNTTSIPFFDDIYLFTSKQINNTTNSTKAKRAVIFTNKAVNVLEDELTTDDADILNNYNMVCHEKKENNYIIIQKDTLFYLLPL